MLSVTCSQLTGFISFTHFCTFWSLMSRFNLGTAVLSLKFLLFCLYGRQHSDQIYPCIICLVYVLLRSQDFLLKYDQLKWHCFCHSGRFSDQRKYIIRIKSINKGWRRTMFISFKKINIDIPKKLNELVFPIYSIEFISNSIVEYINWWVRHTIQYSNDDFRWCLKTSLLISINKLSSSESKCSNSFRFLYGILSFIYSVTPPPFLPFLYLFSGIKCGMSYKSSLFSYQVSVIARNVKLNYRDFK